MLLSWNPNGDCDITERKLVTLNSSRPMSQSFSTMLNCLWKPCEPIHRQVPLQPTFPNYKDPPAGIQEFNYCHTVPDDIQLEFSFPKLHIACRCSCILAALMPMPVAPVNKKHRTISDKDKIRPPRQIFYMKPIAQPATMQEASDQHFRLGILSADASHYPRPDLRCDDVCHVRHYSSTSPRQSIDSPCPTS